MQPQAFRIADQQVVERFLAARADGGGARLQLAWSTWGFGREPFEASVARLAKHGVGWIELHGDHYGPDFGTPVAEMQSILDAHGVKVAGICGMVSPESELASISHVVRQRSIDYFQRHAELCAQLGGRYVLFAAGAVGRPRKDDDHEWLRAVDSAQKIAGAFEQHGVRGALEPVRPDEVSILHTLEEAERMLADIDRPGIRHLNPDLYHMLAGECHLGLAILEHGEKFASIHLADTNRRALGTGHLDLDVVQMALHAVGHAVPDRFCAAEPLGAGGNPYDQMHGPADPEVLDALVSQTATTWRAREEQLLSVDAQELRAAYGLS
jgi:sugar phosphate isomerase/epimerase